MTYERRRLLDQNGEIHEQMKAIVDGANAVKRDMSDDELKQHGDLFDKIMKNKKQIEVLDKQIELDREMADQEAKNAAKQKENKDITVMDGFRGYLLNGPTFRGPGANLFNALQGDSDTAGGFIKTPQEFVLDLLKGIDNVLFLRSKATTFKITTTDSLGVPTLDNDVSDAEWTSEIQTGSDDDTMSFGKRALKTSPLAKRVKISKTLMRHSTMPVDQIVRDRLAYKFGVAQEKGFMTGNGVNQPLGLFTASNNGISTARDISTGNTTTAIVADNLIEVKFSLKTGYLNKAEWIFHRDALKQISKLKDLEGQYMWQPGLVLGQPDILLGRPVNMSEYAPNTFTAGKYVGLLGDLSYYYIAESLGFDLQALFELYAESNRIGLIGRAEVDGMPALEEAFSRVQLAAA